jgi:two-component system chemotaxis response regulator CheB
MIVEPSLVCATRGPKENRFRPAVDPLFRSAAQTYGPRVIGVILTGDLDDGTAGLWAVKQLGGTAIVQDPADALVPSMPESARKHVRIDHSVALADLPALLTRLVAEDLSEAGGYKVSEPIDIEVNIARHDSPLQAGIEKLGIPSIYACPECHGVLLQLRESERLRFRCHTGHAYSVESLLADMDHGIEDSLWESVRGLQEKLLLARHLAHRAREASDEATAAKWHQLAEGAEQRAGWVRQALIEAQRLHASAAAAKVDRTLIPPEA